MKAKTLNTVIKNSFVIVTIIYVISMVLVPLAVGKGDWTYVQRVWMSWQSLNVGLLAFMSTSLIFLIGYSANENQREREFQAALSFLPDALSEICAYLEDCVPLLEEVYFRVKSGEKLKERLDKKPPKLPTNYRSTFRDCIRFSTSEVGDKLSSILQKLQIQQSRIQNLYNKDIIEGSKISVKLIDAQNHIDDCAEIYSLVSNLFEFARRTGPIIEDVSKAHMNNSLFNLHINRKILHEMQDYLKNRYN